VAIRQVAVVHNLLSIWGELPKAVCEPHIESFEEFRFDGEYQPINFANKNLHHPAFGAVCRVKRKDNGREVESAFTLAEADTAGLIARAKGKNGSGPWITYPNRMLQMRARSRALKDLFPDKLSGVSIAEYDHNMLDGKGEPYHSGMVTSSTPLTEKLNSPAEPARKPAALEKHLANAALTEELQDFAASCVAAQDMDALAALTEGLQKFVGPTLTHAKTAYMAAGERLAARAQQRGADDAGGVAHADGGGAGVAAG